MNAILRTALAVTGAALATHAAAQVIFYEHDGFAGRSFTTEKRVGSLERTGFNDRASSVVVLRDRWEACENAGYGGRCIVLRPGRYPSLSAMGLNDRVSSLRPVGANARIEDTRYAPTAIPVYDNRRRNRERVFEANVTSVRAVVGRTEPRCWIEHEQVGQSPGDANVTGAIVGALLGGVLGHQVGSGRGNDIATAGGAVAGAVVGSNIGRDNGHSGYSREVQRCASTPDRSRPDYWDVTYDFRGLEHRIQMASPPGRTVTVNALGEPRA